MVWLSFIYHFLFLLAIHHDTVIIILILYPNKHLVIGPPIVPSKDSGKLQMAKSVDVFKVII